MLEALLHGKLSREQENMEDILTSNVFGLLRYLPPSDGLLQFLGMGRMRDGRQPLANLPEDTTAEYEFWPWIKESGNGCEPDVLLSRTF